MPNLFKAIGGTLAASVVLMALIYADKLFAPKTSFILLCKYGRGDFHTSKIFAVDIKAKTINDSPAYFSENLIEYTGVENGGQINYEINRLSGGLVIHEELPQGMFAVGPPTTGQCEKNPKQLF